MIVSDMDPVCYYTTGQSPNRTIRNDMMRYTLEESKIIRKTIDRMAHERDDRRSETLGQADGFLFVHEATVRFTIWSKEVLC